MDLLATLGRFGWARWAPLLGLAVLLAVPARSDARTRIRLPDNETLAQEIQEFIAEFEEFVDFETGGGTPDRAERTLLAAEFIFALIQSGRLPAADVEKILVLEAALNLEIKTFGVVELHRVLRFVRRHTRP
jgi:hypothetical protein